jgi:hypothetical protein
VTPRLAGDNHVRNNLETARYFDTSAPIHA